MNVGMRIEQVRFFPGGVAMVRRRAHEARNVHSAEAQSA